MASRLLLSTLARKPATGATGAAGVHQWLAPLAAALALGIAAWVGTEWFWYFKNLHRAAGTAVTQAAPAPEARQLAESLASSAIFGTARIAVIAQSTTNVKLKGIVSSGPSGLSAAILNTGARDEVFEVGKDIVPGLVLQAVYPTHILLKNGGRIERIDIEEAKSGAGTQLGLAAGRRSMPPAPGMLPPGVVPGILPGMVPGMPGVPNASPQGNTDPRSRREDHGAIATGRLNLTAAGPTVEDAPPGSLLARIGLQSGDVIKTLDGHPVQPGRDMVRLFQLATSGESMRGEVLRAGNTISVHIGGAQ